jgi:3-deoxy-D-manno-octulosonate 8-phosphate phosphatase (KDO 8-P phosphatase)
MKSSLLLKLKSIKAFLFDLEGVLLKDKSGCDLCFNQISSTYNGFKEEELLFGIITARKEDQFIDKLKTLPGCEVIFSSFDKVSAAGSFLLEHSLGYSDLFYMGDDFLDIPLLEKCGFSAAPRSANRGVKRIVDYVVQADDCTELLKEIITNFKQSKEEASLV